jgi:hypothetical protein
VIWILFWLWSSALEASEEVSGTGEAGWQFGFIVLVIMYEKKRSKCGAVGFLMYKKCVKKVLKKIEK